MRRHSGSTSRAWGLPRAQARLLSHSDGLASSLILSEHKSDLSVLTIPSLVDEYKNVGRSPKPFDAILKRPRVVGLWQPINKTLNKRISGCITNPLVATSSVTKV